MAGKITLPHTCPKCGVVAKTEAELVQIFGYRTKDGGVTNQSHCRKCRWYKARFNHWAARNDCADSIYAICTMLL